MNFLKTLFTLIFLFNFSSLFAQISPYQQNIITPDYKPFEYNTQLATQVLAQKQFNFHLQEARNYADFCLLEPELTKKKSPCILNVADLEHSSWLMAAGSFLYKGKGYSSIFLKGNNKTYYFHYIPPKLLRMWENSSSPGQFYHNIIKPKYSLSNYIKYSP